MIPETICHLEPPPAGRAKRTHFFKFMTRATAEIVMRRGTLRWSTPAHLNDPHDNQFDFSVRVDRERAKEATLKKLWQSHYESGPIDPSNALGALIQKFRGRFPTLTRDEFVREFSPAIDETFDIVTQSVARFNADIQKISATNKLLCVTEQLNETLMWAHYAEAHSGVALRFRSSPTPENIWGIAQQVEYRDSPPELYDVETFSDVMSGRASLNRNAILNRIALTKSSSWLHEKEWRLFAGSGRDRNAPYEDIPFKTWELDAVVVGCRMSIQDRGDIASLVQKRFPHAHLFQARPTREDFGLTFDSMN